MITESLMWSATCSLVGVLAAADRSETSRSETTRGPCASSSMTTAAPTPFSVIPGRLAQRVARADGQHDVRHSLADFHWTLQSSGL